MAQMVTGAASGKADYRERGNRRRLNVEAEDLPANTPSQQVVFVNNVQVKSCPFRPVQPPPGIFCAGELELNTQHGEAIPVITRGQIVSIGMFPSLLSGTFRQTR